ncbi:hypothetical protein Dip518_001281 [Parelusimicrobium proximum]
MKDMANLNTFAPRLTAALTAVIRHVVFSIKYVFMSAKNFEAVKGAYTQG